MPLSKYNLRLNYCLARNRVQAITKFIFQYLYKWVEYGS
jgi:hypothetical protein